MNKREKEIAWKAVSNGIQEWRRNICYDKDATNSIKNQCKYLIQTRENMIRDWNYCNEKRKNNISYYLSLVVGMVSICKQCGMLDWLEERCSKRTLREMYAMYDEDLLNKYILNS